MSTRELHVDLNKPDPEEPGWKPTTGTIQLRPYSRHIVEDEVIVPQSYSLTLVGGEATAEVVVGWVYKSVERIRGGVSRYFLIPSGTGTVEYADLPDVDPETLEPTPAAEAAWEVESAAREADVAELQAAIDAVDSGAAGGLAAEITRATNAENAEASARAAADTALDGRLDTLETQAGTFGDIITHDAAEFSTPTDLSAALNALVDAAPGTLDTLNELAAALGDDPNFAATMTTALASKAAATDLSAETSARQSAITSEAATRAAADTTNATNITAETTRATAAERKRLLSPGPAVVGQIGASITNNGTLSYYDATLSGCISYGSLNPMSYGLPKTKGRFVAGGTASTVGYTTAQMISTHLPNVLLSNWDYCIVGEVTNDLGNSVPIATTRANITTIITALLDHGIMPILTTVPPNDSYASGAGLTWITQYNEWVKRQARLYRCPIVDYHSVLVNPSTNAYASGYSSDGTHPTANGAKPMGDHLGDVLAAIPGPVRSPQSASYNPNNMIPDVCANSAGSDKIVASGNTTGGWCFASVPSANWKGNAPTVYRGSVGNYQIAWPVTAGAMVAGHRCRLTFNIDVAGITIGSGTWSAYLYNDTQSQVVCGFNGATHPLNDGTSITATDAAVTSGSNLITCATSKPFRQAMVGNNVSVLSGVSTRFAAGTTIIGVGADGTTAYASANSAATASSQTMVVQGKPLSAVFEFDVQSDMVGDTFTFYMIAGAAAGTAIAVSQVTLVDLTALGVA